MVKTIFVACILSLIVPSVGSHKLMASDEKNVAQGSEKDTATSQANQRKEQSKKDKAAKVPADKQDKVEKQTEKDAQQEREKAPAKEVSKKSDDKKSADKAGSKEKVDSEQKKKTGKKEAPKEEQEDKKSVDKDSSEGNKKSKKTQESKKPSSTSENSENKEKKKEDKPQEQKTEKKEIASEKKSAPQPESKDKKKSEPESVEQVDIEGIDTVDVDTPAGNWLLKRIWWEKAKDKFNKIRIEVNKIADAPMNFFARQNDLEKNTLDPFYRELGLEQGELQEVIKTLIDKIKQERSEEGSLEFSERDILQKLQEEQKSFEQIDKDASALNELDAQLDDALTLLLKQVNQARSYENQAWEYFDAIAHELSDQKAQELYYSMDGLLKDIKKINAYVQKDFAQYFSKMLNKAEDQTKRIKDTVSELKEKGIDLKEQLEKLTQEPPTQEPRKEEAGGDQGAGEKHEQKSEKKGWFASLWSWLTGSS